MQTIEVTSKYDNVRLDVFLSENINSMSRSGLKKIIENKDILINNKICKASTKLKAGDIVSISFLEQTQKSIISQNIKLDIIYEDDDLIVVNKPRGMVVHPASGNYENTLLNALLHHTNGKLSSVNSQERAGIVHRIDKDTSGLLLVAKNNKSHENLAVQLKEHSIKRQYTFICHGIIDEETVIEKPLGRNPKNRLQMAVVDAGKYAYTTIYPIEVFDNYSYAKAILKTGRTHQIRVHLRYINRAIVGDKVYSNYKESINGQLLHAATLGFIHPGSEKYMEFSIEEPDIFKKELEKLRTKNIY